MAGSEENELDTSPCEDEVVVKEGRKRRAEVQEEDVDGNRSRLLTQEQRLFFATLGVLLMNSKLQLVQFCKRLKIQSMKN